MKKSTLLIAGLLALGSTTMHADEGMWTLYNLPDAVYEQMVAEGFQLPRNMLYGAPNAISNSVINFSGFCSGVVVSPKGLVFTNHHCGFGAINALSTVEHDYMKDGFYAKSYAEELPSKDLFVSFMKKQEDITPRVNKLIAGKNAEQTEAIIDSLTNHLTDSIKAIDKTLHIQEGLAILDKDIPIEVHSLSFLVEELYIGSEGRKVLISHDGGRQVTHIILIEGKVP